MQNARNILLFVALAIMILVGWGQLEKRLWPPRPPEPKKTAETTQPKDKEPAKPPANEPPKTAPPPIGVWATLLGEARRAVGRYRTPVEELISLGSKGGDSKYLLYVLLDPRGASVFSVLLNRFKEGDSLGRPTPYPLLLVPPEDYGGRSSFQLFHFASPTAADERPLETLGQVIWKKTAEVGDSVQTSEGPRARKTVSFQTEINGVRITKTFSLTEGEYHLGLEVRLACAEGTTKPVKFRYQLAGAHGLPVDGKWYTSVFRNALIGRVDHNSVWRDLQDLRQISVWEGGKPIGKEKNYIIRYAGVAVQYFASVIVVDDDQPQQDFVARARPTLEAFVLKGRITKIAPGQATFVLVTDDHKEETIFVPEDNPLRKLADIGDNQRRAILATRDGNDHTVALEITDEATAQPLWRDDITVRVTTEAAELRPDAPDVVHKYLLYNGPLKPSLLGLPGHDSGVTSEVVARYVDKLKLNTMTDYQSQSWIGNVSSAIYWTDLIIWFTNLMHRVLSLIHWVVPNYGLCIICLTMLVRGMMFPISRKQALMSLKMQELAPEMKKAQEKFKDDRQAAGLATMELYRKHGVNPFGTCWFLILQMPVFMGLYFALQESIYFRLAGAWPLWIHNLAAPDMLWEWGVPYISNPANYGSMFYLGPYLNLLPMFAVALMIMQQKMMTPPPQDEQQATQQKIMKYMMVFFGVMFYKVAAGLCFYFIASSVWGFCERKLLPKKNLKIGPVSADAALREALDRPASSGSSSSAVKVGASASVTGALDGRGKKQGRNRKSLDGERSRQEPAPVSNSAWSRFRRRVSDWWAEVLKKAEKK